MTKISVLIEWLKQPPTLKGIILVLGMAGFAVDPDKVQQIIITVTSLYAALALFYDNSKRSPKIPTPEELNQFLKSEDIVKLVQLRKAKIAAAKELGGGAE